MHLSGAVHRLHRLSGTAHTTIQFSSIGYENGYDRANRGEWWSIGSTSACRSVLCTDGMFEESICAMWHTFLEINHSKTENGCRGITRVWHVSQGSTVIAVPSQA